MKKFILCVVFCLSCSHQIFIDYPVPPVVEVVALHDDAGDLTAFGTGWYLDSHHVVTAAHVTLNDTTRTWVIQEGPIGRFGRVVYLDVFRDLAILEPTIPRDTPPPGICDAGIGDRVTIVSIRKGVPTPVATDVQIDNKIGNSLYSTEYHPVSGDSGSPVFDKNTHCVVGIVVANHKKLGVRIERVIDTLEQYRMRK